MKNKRRKKRNTSDNPQAPAVNEKQQPTRMLARCAACVKDYAPRGRGGAEISNLKLFYIPHEKLDANKSSLVCPMHKDKTELAGLIVSEDCLENKFGSAMGMIAFCFTDEEIAAARENQIWPKIKNKIEIDANVISSMSDEEMLKFVKNQIKHTKPAGGRGTL